MHHVGALAYWRLGDAPCWCIGAREMVSWGIGHYMPIIKEARGLYYELI